ncbi:DUF6086 family protein [Nonomuraea basaltis]|uniref:DUF6086 family protein n=1 Tax=Nonomuraea basaltis TaxID=2495887 RepID=UPI00110C64BB|nr:DUF6086 family protein [Nonomuraea basaltis]TMR89706.1 hypothetical protein EJK15_59270 [Nonomuraea basaltis]
MSQYFQIEDNVLWNPATGVSRVFVRTAESLSLLVDLPSGLGPMCADECEIDIEAFALFIDTLASRYARSNHVILRSLMEGFIATGMALVERGGGELPGVKVARDDPSISALQELSRRHSRAMPR